MIDRRQLLRSLAIATPSVLGIGAVGQALAQDARAARLIAANVCQVTPATTLGEVYPGLPGELAVTTLTELATHTSGLPRLSTRAQLRSLVTNLTYGNPYEWDTPESLLSDAGSTWLRTPRGE